MSQYNCKSSTSFSSLFVSSPSLVQIWVGCSGPSPDQCRMSGKIYIVDTESHSVEKELMAHTDSVQALCSAEGRYVLSGSACQDGKIAIWKVE
jgi:WD40 repeat protein